MKERDLREPVARWLADQGHGVAYERLLGGYCDVLGFRFAERIDRRIPSLLDLIAVELKLDRITEAISQARAYARNGALSFVAMPSDRCARVRQDTLRAFTNARIGLLSVGPDVGVAAIMPGYYWNLERHGAQIKRKIWRIRRETERNAP